MVSEYFSKIKSSWVGKIIFAFILFGMVFVWGYGGLTNTFRYSNEAVRVGSSVLSMSQLDEVFKQERVHLSDMMGGRYISPKEAIEMGLLDSIVRQQTNKMIMNGIKDELGLIASNHAVQKYIEHNPVFADATGHFDRALFMAYLQQAKTNEQKLGHDLQDELAEQHLMRAIQNISYAPYSLIEKAYQEQLETRDITAVLIRADQVKGVEEPDMADLQDFYDMYAAEKFVVPEYRSFVYLNLTPESVLNLVQVNNDEIDAVVQEQQDSFNTPEKRHVRQLYFQNEADAQEAMTGLTMTTFDAVAKTSGQTETDFGYVARGDLKDELDEAVFKASKNQILGPLATQTGWHILWVQDIQAAHITPITEVRQLVKKQLALAKAYDTREEIIRELEDKLGEGLSLTVAADQLKLPLQRIEAIDATGQKRDGTTLTEPLNNPELLQSLFSTKTGEVTPFFEEGEGLLVAEVTDISPVTTRSFDDVKAELRQLWNAQQAQALLKKAADDIVQQAQEGTPLSKQMSAVEFGLIQKEKVHRLTDTDLPPTVLQAAFAQPVGLAGTVQVPVGENIMIVTTDRVHKPTPDTASEDWTKAEQSMQEATGAVLFDALMAAYTQKFGVIVNDTDINRTFEVYTKE